MNNNTDFQTQTLDVTQQFRVIQLILATLFALLGNWMVVSTIAYADSPPNITTDIPWSDTGGAINFMTGENTGATFGGVEDVVAAFNNARRQEEIQLGLAPNTIGTLDLPSQAVWDTMSDDNKMLMIINEERVDRAGMMPDVIGLPLEGVHPDIDSVAQNYADLLVSMNVFGHTYDGGPYDRVARAFGACHETLSAVENIAAFYTPDGENELYIEQSVYKWIYVDAMANWGHRVSILLQDSDLATGNINMGFKDNVGEMGSEGFMGVGVVHSPNYNGGQSGVTMGTAVVMKVFDPSPDASCGWAVTAVDDKASGQQAGVEKPLDASSGAGTEAISTSADNTAVSEVNTEQSSQPQITTFSRENRVEPALPAKTDASAAVVEVAISEPAVAEVSEPAPEELPMVLPTTGLSLQSRGTQGALVSLLLIVCLGCVAFLERYQRDA
ncbi:MAG: hypothetical protein AAF639_11810 [Chloroflexota bacterium]